MKTLTIRFTRDFYTVIPRKKNFRAGETLEIDVDAENFPIHSFWQNRFNENNGDSVAFEIIDAEVTSDKPKKAK